MTAGASHLERVAAVPTRTQAMTIIYHDEHPADRAAVLAMRAVIALNSPAPIGPEARPDFDTTIARTPLAESVDYEPATVGGVPGWWCRPAEPRQDGVILYHHGGAYVLGSAAAYRHFVGQLAARAGLAAFVADYALAPERPFPAAVDDALACYRGLADLGHRRIALAGDSAGGGLTFSLLAAAGRLSDLPRPLGALALSPWTDLALTGASMETRAQADPMLTRERLDQAAQLYLGERGRDAPEASPLRGALAGLPPVQIHVGDAEILLDDSLRYVERIVATGGEGTAHVWAGMVHVFPAAIGTLRAASEALDIAGAFLKSLR